jgi:hypothetical protein
MRRVPISLRHKAAWWMELRTPTGFEDEHAEGATAYATKQSMLYTDLAAEFETMWAPVRDLEEVDGEEIMAAEREADEDDGEADNDGDDGVDGEDGGEEDVEGEEEEEGSLGGLTDGGEE